MAKHTIETLTQDLANFKRTVNGRFTSLNKTLADIQPKVQEMHEYVLVQNALQENHGKGNGSDGSINISKDVWGLIIKLVLIIAGVLGIKSLNP